MTMGNQRFGLYGFFGAIALALLMNNLMGCASPASAAVERPVRIERFTHGERTVEQVGDTTITVEPAEVTLYYYNH